jgi:type VI secretion system protein ImpB
MPESDSIQHKLDRVRSPRVQITYDVETGTAIVKKELPLVVGVLADLSGNVPLDATTNQPYLKPLKQRSFVEIDRDNFDVVLSKSAPKLHLSGTAKGVADSPGNAVFPVDIEFSELDSFTPFSIVSQVPALKALWDSRNRLADLSAKLDGNAPLETMLRDAVQKNLTDLEALPQIEAVS